MGLAFAVLLLALGASFAAAEQGTEASTLYPVSAIEEAAQTESVEVIGEPATDPQAAEELPHEDLDRDEAGDLLVSVFGEILEEPSGVYADLDVEAFRSDYAAVVPVDQGDGSGSALLTSTLPLRTEDDTGHKSVVDLGLVQSEGELEAANPLVDVEIPAELGEGIEIPEAGVTVEFAGAPVDRAPTALEDTTAFYPNVAPDSDLTVVPTPTGFETFTQLRSADAPTVQVFDLDLPNGAVLQETEDGGAAVKRDGETLMAVHPPTALDAGGQPVPVDLSVAGHSIELSVEPSPFAAYPLLVDPIFESYMWIPNTTFAGTEDWIKASNSPLFTGSTLSNWNEQFYIGLYMNSQPGAITPGAQVNWNYYVPRYFTDTPAKPTSYIKSATFSQVKYAIDEGVPYRSAPVFVAGIWSMNKGQWVSVYSRDGSQGPLTSPTSIPLPNPADITDGSNVGIALLSAEAQSYPRRVIVGQATVELGDKDDPEVEQLGGAVQWVNDQPSSAISYSVVDRGLGIYELQVTQPRAKGGTSQVSTSVGCIGNVSKPCPRGLTEVAKALNYEPKEMAQGEHLLKFAAVDPVGRRSDVGLVAQTKVKVDHTPPSLTLSGTATEQATVGTKLPTYTLKYGATDGDSTPPEVLSSVGTAGSGPGQMQRPMAVAVDADGNIWVADRENNRVQKFDKNGVFQMQFGSAGAGNGQFNDPRGIAVSPKTGNIWVSEMGGNRLQEFKPNGEFVRKVTAPGSGIFIDPYGIAIGANGTLWVADMGSKVVWMLNETGQVLGNGHGTSTLPTSGAIDLAGPVGVAVDAYGNAWVTDATLARVTQYAKDDGRWLSQFGTLGSADGQLNAPNGIAVAPSGGILVADGLNSRIQQFKSDGSFMRKFGSAGSGAGQLSEPRGLVVNANGTVLVADASNKRIARWAHADLNNQSGTVKAEIKLDGQLVRPADTQSCSKNCPLTSEWTLNADNYSVGTHNLEVIATDGVGLSTTKAMTIETHGDLAAPTIALSGSMTEQATYGTWRPSYVLKVNATDPGLATERQSGVASLKIKVDGKEVDSTSPGCVAGGCSISREWTLQSSGYSAGSHVATVTATDAAGKSKTETLNFTITPDTTAPVLNPSGNLYSAPEGWVEQKSYSAFAIASDPSGYGVTEIRLKIDGQTAKVTTTSCPSGGCEWAMFSSVNMSAYDGGAHSAELTAKDGAGNVAKKVWTINASPKGPLSPGEAEATLEAFDKTSDANTIGVAEEEEIEGTSSELSLRDEGDVLGAEGSVSPVSVDTGPTGAIQIEVPDRTTLPLPCEGEGESIGEGATGEQEEAAATEAVADCVTLPLIPDGSTTEPITIEPSVPGVGSPGTVLTKEEAAGLAPGEEASSAAVVRPLRDGALTFSAITDPSGPSSFSWEVQLDPEQELKALSGAQVGVYWPEGALAFTISAIPAHDAIGTSVPTSFTVSGDSILTLHVNHAGGGANGQPFTYPVVAGVGWEGGFRTYEVTIEDDPGEGIEELSLESGVSAVLGRSFVLGPPVDASNDQSLAWLQNEAPKDIPVRKRSYLQNACAWEILTPEADPNPKPGSGLPPSSHISNINGCKPKNIEGKIFPIKWAVAVHGTFFYKWGRRVVLKEPPDCEKWGLTPPALIQCFADVWNSTSGINLLGRYRFRPGILYIAPTCYEINPVLPLRPIKPEPGFPFYPNYHESYEPLEHSDEHCDWGHIKQQH